MRIPPRLSIYTFPRHYCCMGDGMMRLGRFAATARIRLLVPTVDNNTAVPPCRFPYCSPTIVGAGRPACHAATGERSELSGFVKTTRRRRAKHSSSS
nr:hypothetical protein CFP56_75195 [Quercus suber]